MKNKLILTSVLLTCLAATTFAKAEDTKAPVSVVTPTGETLQVTAGSENSDPPCKGKNVGYSNGFFIQTDDCLFKLTTNVELQPQFQYLNIKGANNNVATFQIRRARFSFGGNVFDKNLTFRMQFEPVSGRTNTTSEADAITGPNLREGYINYLWRDYFQVKVGQFKPMFNREELTSSTQQQFVDQSIANDVFTQGYDLGLALWGKAFENKLEWATYVINEGNNRNTLNRNNEFAFGGRLDYNIFGTHGMTMSDVKDSQDAQWVVGAAANINKPNRATDNTISTYTLDSAFKYRGFSALAATYFGRDHTDSQSIYGFHFQTGYFLIPKHLEVAARGVGVIPKGAFGTNGYEYGGVVNYFFKGHNIKLQTDYSMLVNSPLVGGGANAAGNFIANGNAPAFIKNQNDHRIRTQLQLAF